MSREAWLEERKTYIGASEIAAVCGLNPWMSPRILWEIKKGLREVDENRRMQAGSHMEALIVKWWADEKGLDESSLRIGETVRHEKYPYMACTPDRILPDGSLLEVKLVTGSAADNWGPPMTDQVADHYLMQVCWQMGIMKAKKAYLCAYLMLNDDLRTYVFTWNDQMKAMFRHAAEHARDFWVQHIEADVPPPLTGEYCDTQYLKEKHKDADNEKRIIADGEIESIVKDIEDIFKQKNAFEKEYNRRLNLIRESMGDAAILETTVGAFTWKANVKGVRTLRTPIRGEGV